MTLAHLLELALHQLWLGAALAALVAIALAAWRGWSAESRYWLWMASLVVVAALPLLSLVPGPQTPVLREWLLDGASSIADGSTALVPTEANHTGVTAFDWTLAIAAVWAFGFAWRLYALLAGARALRQWIREARAVPAHSLPLSGAALSHCEVRESAHASVPMVAGLLRPCILMPRGLHERLSRSELSLVLRHEAAHARRRDSWFLLMQRLIEAAYFYNPVVHWIARRIERERECSCDDRALDAQPEQRAEYAQCLISVSRTALRHRPPSVAVGAFRRPSELGARVQRLLDASHATHLNSAPLAVACAALVAAGALCSLVLPRAHAEAAEQPADAATGITRRALARELAEGAIDVAQAQELIRAGADVNYRLAGDGTPLILAARRGDLPMVRFLIQSGAEVDRFSNGDGNPLIVAAQAGHVPVVQLLVESGADVNAFDVYDESPLINAARGGHVPVIDYLLGKGADVNLTVQSQTIHGVAGRSALSEARKHGNEAVVQRLLQNGAAQ